MPPWLRPVLLTAAALLAGWSLYLFQSESTVEVTDLVTLTEGERPEEWTGTLSCASLDDFTFGTVNNYDWIVEDDGTETMSAPFEQTTQLACGGKRAARAALVGVGSALATGCLVGGLLPARRPDPEPTVPA